MPPELSEILAPRQPGAVEQVVVNAFLRDAAQLASSATAKRLRTALQLCDLTLASEQPFLSRRFKRKVILHVGPTNSGKTHAALVAMARARTGIYAGPLRLLAHEVFSRFKAGTAPGLDGTPRACNLITGEERRIEHEFAGLLSCTVEMMPRTKEFDVAVIDEIQMLTDPSRGSIWTNALLYVNAKEVHCCGEATVVDVVTRLAKLCSDEVEVRHYQRLNPLQIAHKSLHGNWSNVQRGDCIVTFSRAGIFQIKAAIESTTKLKVAVVYGSLPPEVREWQARRFNSQDLDVLVATDAIGMGLNLCVATSVSWRPDESCQADYFTVVTRRIKRIVFHRVYKYDGQGTEMQLVTQSQMKQIAGRAGRYGLSRDDGPATGPDTRSTTSNVDNVGVVTTWNDASLAYLQLAMKSPTEALPRAALTPINMDALATMMPPGTSYYALLHASMMLSRPRPELYVALHTSVVGMAARTADINGLTLFEIQTFCTAPANPNVVPVLNTLRDYMRRHAAGDRVDPQVWARQRGVVRLLERILAARPVALEAMRNRRDHPDIALPPPTTEKTPTAGAATPPSATGSGMATQGELTSADTLHGLEEAHKVMTMYSWLAYRLPGTFFDLMGARDLCERCQVAIDICLDARAARARPRLRSSSSSRAIASGLSSFASQKPPPPPAGAFASSAVLPVSAPSPVG